MRTADALGCLSLEEVGVVFAPHQFPGVLVNLVVQGNTAQVGQSEQTGHVGIVHEGGVSKTVDLIGIHLAIFGMIYDGILLDGSFHLIGQRPAFNRKITVAGHRIADFGHLPE